MIGQFNFGQMDGTIVQGFELRNSNGLLGSGPVKGIHKQAII